MPHDPVRSGKWFRFQKYEIVQGALRPVQGCELQRYDPWQTFEAARDKYRTVHTLWGEFAELVRRVGTSPNGESLMLEWSDRYGLLGILPGSADHIVLPATYERAEQFGMPDVLTGRCIVQRRHVRIGGSWITDEAGTGDPVNVPIEAPPWSPGELVRQEDSSHPGVVRPSSLFWRGDDREWTADQGNRHLSNFFSPQPANGQYPQPATPAFWAIYQEPVSAWRLVARDFAEAIERVSQFACALDSRKDWPDQRLNDVNLALWTLNRLAGAEAFSYEFGPRVLKRELSSASLLATMAEMFFQDVMYGRRARRCGSCQRLFVSNEQRAAYCSVRCRNTVQVRRHRQRIKKGGRPTTPGHE